MYRLIAIDLDGTLLGLDKQISDIDKETIIYSIKRGIRVIVCSGRIYAGAKTFASYLGLSGPIIACNGALIKDMDTNEVLYSDFLEFEDCKKIIDICHYADIYFHIYAGDTMYTEKLEFSSKFYWDKNRNLPEAKRVDIRLTDNIESEISLEASNISKIVVVSNDSEKLLRVRRSVEDLKSVSVMSSSSDNFEVVNLGVSKGKALKYLADKLGINKDEIMAIGDNENDISMLEFAGLAVAMGNSENEIKEIAHYITLSNNENGVAEAIKKFV